ncbi:hypothetical protein IRJ41_009028, partial [Triplophysa rosa]
SLVGFHGTGCVIQSSWTELNHSLHPVILSTGSFGGSPAEKRESYFNTHWWGLCLQPLSHLAEKLDSNYSTSTGNSVEMEIATS